MRSVYATTFLVGVASLMVELVQVRMLAFLLGAGMDFLAIPLALLGLAMGSLACHFLWRRPVAELVPVAARALFPALLVSFLGVFFVADHWFFEVQAHRGYADPGGEALRLVTYATLCLPPYVGFGALLASVFSAHADRVGRLYFFDLAGAALGCVLAPSLLTLFDLPEAITAIFGLGLALLLLHPPRARAWLPLATAVFVVVAGLGHQRRLLREHPDPTFLSSAALGHLTSKGAVVEPIDVRWNEVARTALVRAADSYAIVQDNGLSNVTLLPWDPAARERPYRGHRALPWRMGLEPRSILVVFAGAGRDMIAFDQLSKGEAQIVGVELNPDVVGIVDHPAVAHLHLAEFVAEPNIELVNAEGRAFLEGDDRRYDLIHVANNGAVFSLRTGHTRKFLDTEEAMAAYLEHLQPGGMIVFSNQPVEEKIVAFERLLPNAGVALALTGRPDEPWLDTLIVKPTGLTTADREAIARIAKGQREQLLDLRRGGLHVTDDRPFTRRLELSELPLWPGDTHEPWQLSSWVKVFTVALFALASGLVGLGAVAVGGRAPRLPVPWVIYLLASGVGYMGVEVGLIARTELFLGNPLYSVAVNLALFLVANAVGAAVQDRWAPLGSPGRLFAATVVTVGWSLLVTTLAKEALLSVALPLKVLGIATATVPVGIVLGMFYPYAVSRLVAAGRGAAVPITYGLTTLASVLGSSLAMTAMIDVGFTRLIALGAVAYGFACLAAWQVSSKEATSGALGR